MSSSALCDIRAWETGGYFWNIILKSREGYQVSFHLLVLIWGANHTTVLNDKMKSYVVRSKKRRENVLHSWGLPVVIRAFTTKPMLPQLLSASDLLMWSLLCGLSQTDQCRNLCSPYLSPPQDRKWASLSRETVVFLSVCGNSQIHGIIDIT